MRMLEEAIRDHLELKRRHGADPREVAILERQAFGVESADAEGGGDAGRSVNSAEAGDDAHEWTEELIFD